jgi:hypothetical protein
MKSHTTQVYPAPVTPRKMKSVEHRTEKILYRKFVKKKKVFLNKKDRNRRSKKGA